MKREERRKEDEEEEERTHAREGENTSSTHAYTSTHGQEVDKDGQSIEFFI